MFLFSHKSDFLGFGVQSIHILGHLQPLAKIEVAGADCIGRKFAGGTSGLHPHSEEASDGEGDKEGDLSILNWG